MIVIVDSNEQVTSSKTVEGLKKYFKNVIIVPKLPAGDINIPLDDGTVLAIERKTPMDFLQSIGDGRLKEQIYKMHQQAKYSAIVITGRINYANEMAKADDKETKWKSVSVRGMLRSIQLSGTILEWCPAKEYPAIVQEIYETCNTSNHGQGLIKREIITFPPIDERVNLLGQLPGVGIESAESLLKFAGMMDNNADEEGFGTVASALHHLSIMAQYGKSARPRLWNGKSGARKVMNNRLLLGLKSNQYIDVLEEK